MMNFKLPFPEWQLTSTVKVFKTELNENGKPVPMTLYEGLARYDEKSRQVLNANRELVLISGMIVCKGDIVADAWGTASLSVEVNGITKKVMSVSRPKNPDGSIFSTELTLT